MGKDPSKGKVIEFSSARKSAESATEVKAAANAAPAPRGGGFMETWLKGHEDSQALVKENLSLREQQRRLEEERGDFIPNTSESLLYYISLGIATLILIGTLAAIFIKAS